MSDTEDEEYNFVGTALLEENSQRKRLDTNITDVAATRLAPLWHQEVTDQEGRRRFHGAFTGGFSAGYYNTVGSKVLLITN